MKRLLLASLLACSGLFFVSAQNQITIYGLKGPSGIGMVRLFEDPPAVSGYHVQVEALAAADLMAAKFLSGEAKIGILPPNVAAKLAAAGRPLQLAAVVGNGMLSLITNDSNVHSIDDLRGKKIDVAGQGATPDFVFRKILASHGMNPDTDLELSYALAYPEIAQSLIAGRISNAVLPEPFASMALRGNSGLRSIGDIQQEWQRAGGNANYPMTVLVLDASYAAENSELITAILDEYRASIAWVVENPETAAQLVAKHKLGLTPAVAAAAIPKSNYVFIPAREAKPALEALFSAFLEYAPASIGAKLPADDFYR